VRSRTASGVGNRVAEAGNALDPVGADLRLQLVSVTVYNHSPHSSVLCSAAAFLSVGAEFQFGFFAHEPDGCGAEARLILAHLAF